MTSIPTRGQPEVRMYSHVVGVRLSVVGAVSLYAVTTAAGGTTDPVSVCHRRNIDMQVIRKCHGVVSIGRLLMWTRLLSMVTMFRLPTPSAYFMILVMILCSIPHLRQCIPQVAVRLIQVWLVPLVQAVLVVAALGRDPVWGPAEVAMCRICIVRRRTTYASWWSMRTAWRGKQQSLCTYATTWGLISWSCQKPSLTSPCAQRNSCPRTTLWFERIMHCMAVVLWSLPGEASS